MSAYYALYHVVVVLYFLPEWYAAVAFLFLMGVGRFFQWCRETPRLGIVTSLGGHAGLDLCLCLVLGSMYREVTRDL